MLTTLARVKQVESSVGAVDGVGLRDLAAVPLEVPGTWSREKLFPVPQVYGASCISFCLPFYEQIVVQTIKLQGGGLQNKKKRLKNKRFKS